MATAPEATNSQSLGPHAALLKAYSVLERELHRVRTAVLAQATMSALQKSAKATFISSDDILAALATIAATGDLNWSAPPKQLARESSPLLERRLEALGQLVIKQATSLAAEGGAAPLDYPQVTPELIESAWDFVWNNPNFRYALLVKAD
ncbi:MAG TPA: hypothetical protein VHV55_03985 [Pirellulales bacterium]|jgi:hypothetical protein|nr:hypothetical protein [Pirellulales bacterium]